MSVRDSLVDGAVLLASTIPRTLAAAISIGDAVISTDTGGRITFINPAAEAETGWTRAKALGGNRACVHGRRGGSRPTALAG
jgi:PAS domain-containing protein